MDFNYFQALVSGDEELIEYIKQIKSYEEHVKDVEFRAEEEEKLKKLRPVLKLVLWTGIAGMCFYINEETEQGRKIKKSLVEGVELTLEREPDNKYDKWAIAIYGPNGDKLGYVTRYKNETIARLMDQGYIFKAFVESKKQVNYNAKQQAATENFDIPFSIWME